MSSLSRLAGLQRTASVDAADAFTGACWIAGRLHNYSVHAAHELCGCRASKRLWRYSKGGRRRTVWVNSYAIRPAMSRTSYDDSSLHEPASNARGQRCFGSSSSMRHGVRRLAGGLPSAALIPSMRAQNVAQAVSRRARDAPNSCCRARTALRRRSAYKLPAQRLALYPNAAGGLLRTRTVLR